MTPHHSSKCNWVSPVATTILCCVLPALMLSHYEVTSEERFLMNVESISCEIKYPRFWSTQLSDMIKILSRYILYCNHYVKCILSIRPFPQCHFPTKQFPHLPLSHHAIFSPELFSTHPFPQDVSPSGCFPNHPFSNQDAFPPIHFQIKIFS